MKMQAELENLPIGLSPLPDETLFSWCSRYHRLAANGQDRNTSIQLFGDARAGLAHDFPARIAVLVDRSRGALGTASEIMRRMTLLPFYLPFKSRALGGIAEAALLGDGITHLKYRLGLLTSGLGAAHPLKACRGCVARDLGRHGWAYWRRSHQLPGVWLCPQHQTGLTIYPIRTQQLFRCGWTLPVADEGASLNCLEGLLLTSPEAKWLLKLGCLSTELMSYEAGRFADTARVANAIRGRLSALGMTHASGRIRWPQIMPYLHELPPTLIKLPGLNHEANSRLLQDQLQRLLSGRPASHPLRNLVWITVWFKDLTDFQHEYDSPKEHAQCIEDGKSSEVQAQLAPTNEYTDLLASAGRGDITMTAVARQIGVSYSTVAAWASKMQIAARRRPKKLIASRWDRAVAMLQEGAAKADVANACQSSVITVTRILRTVPGLQDRWHEVQHLRRRDSARQAWNAITKLRAYMGIAALRHLEPAAYAWLYRNDREWLRSSSDNVPRTAGSNHAYKRITNADFRMAAALKILAAQWVSLSNCRTLDEISRSLPGIRKAIANPERWPSTISALSSALGYRLMGLDRESMLC
jgi:hypothetical protein